MAEEKATTTIGSTIVINGEFKSAEDVSVQGTVKGRIETSADLFVEEGGTVEAEISTRNIDIRGTVVGNVTAAERFEMHAGGSVTGDIRAPRVVLADGAKYKGNIDMDAAGAVRREPTAVKTERKPR
ncbi:MAG: polymer-forming cytoskeletal protein [Myxococcota bacterium]